MKITTSAFASLPLLFGLVVAPVNAAVITFDFLDLVENQTSNITGRLSDGSAYAGAPLATSYEYFQWNNQGLGLTVFTEQEVPDDMGEVTDVVLPAFVALQPGFAGIGTCRQADCSQASRLSYLDRLIFDFSEVVEIVTVEFSIGEDDSNRPEDYEDYRGYDGRLHATGGPDGPMSTTKGSRYDWNGSLFGNRLEYYRNEGISAYIESITVRTADTVEVPAPATLSLMLIGLLVGGLGRLHSLRRA